MKATTVHPKVVAGGVAGAATVVLIGIAERLGLNVQPEEASAVTVLFAFLAGYLKSS